MHKTQPAIKNKVHKPNVEKDKLKVEKVDAVIARKRTRSYSSEDEKGDDDDTNGDDMPIDEIPIAATKWALSLADRAPRKNYYESSITDDQDESDDGEEEEEEEDDGSSSDDGEQDFTEDEELESESSEENSLQVVEVNNDARVFLKSDKRQEMVCSRGACKKRQPNGQLAKKKVTVKTVCSNLQPLYCEHCELIFCNECHSYHFTSDRKGNRRCKCEMMLANGQQPTVKEFPELLSTLKYRLLVSTFPF